MLRKIIPLLILITGFSVLASAQNFDGIIEFKKQVGATTTNYVYYIKGDKVRVDEFTPGTRMVEGSYILDIKMNTMMYLNHGKKTWENREPKSNSAASAGSVVSATKNTKEIFGFKCNEQIVRNEMDSTSINYFVASGKFLFYIPTLKMLGSEEKIVTYFLAIPTKEGTMPLLAIVKDTNGNEKERMEVTRLEQKVIVSGMFDIPKDYTEVK